MKKLAIRVLAGITAALGLCAAIPALAAPDGMWVNPSGAVSRLKVEGGPVVPLKPGNRTLAEIALGFDLLCLGTDFDKLRVNPIISGSGWGGQYMPSIMKIASGDVDLGGWQGDDHALLVAKDAFFSPNPQCTLTVATATRYPAHELFTILKARFNDPANFTQMFNAAGKPNDSVRPYWLLPAATNDRERVVFARSLARGSEYRIHLALIERKKAP